MKRASPSRLVLLLVLGLASTARAERPSGKPGLDRRIDALFRVRHFKEAALAPNGLWLAWVEDVPAKGSVATSHSAVFVANLRAQEWAPQRLTAGDGKATHAEHDLAWSPDSRRLAFL